MDCQVLLESKGHRAQVALEWLLARMGQLVALDMPPPGARVMAHLTPKKTVSPQVLQARKRRSRCHRRYSTNGATGKVRCSFPDMSSQLWSQLEKRVALCMPCEAPQQAEASWAKFALVSLRVVCPHMRHHVLLLVKSHRAQVAGESIISRVKSLMAF